MDIQEFSPSIPVECYIEPLNNFYHEELSPLISVERYNESLNNENMDTDISNFSNEENDSNFLSLQKGQTFEIFEEVEKYLMQYCEQKGFEYRKRRVEYDENNVVRKRTYECTKAAQYKSRKDNDSEKHRQRNSGSIGCQW